MIRKKKFLTVTLITVAAASLASGLSWFDEFVHFYPLIIPLLLTLGFDSFSSLFCLYSGSIAGLLGMISTERMGRHFSQSFDSVEGKVNFTNTAGMWLRIITFLVFTTIVVLFNLWYCNRNPKSEQEEKDLVREVSPPFTKTRKIILAIAGFFLFISFLGQITPIANFFGSSAEKISPYVTSEFEKKEYQELGDIGEIETAKVKTETESYWGVFGKWEERALDCWLFVGGIIICLLAKMSIFNVLIDAMKNSLPLILVYVFAAAPAVILKNSGVSQGIAKFILPKSVSGVIAKYAKFLALFLVFIFSLLFTWLIATPTMSATLISVFAPTLLAISESTLIYAALFAWIGAIIGIAFSPNNGILLASFEKTKITYGQFLKKTWKLGAVMITSALILICIWANFMVK